MKNSVWKLMLEMQKDLRTVGQSLEEDPTTGCIDTKALKQNTQTVFRKFEQVLEDVKSDLYATGLGEIPQVVDIEEGYEKLRNTWKKQMVNPKNLSNDAYRLLVVKIYVECLWLLEQMLAFFQGMAHPMNLFKWALEPRRGLLEECRNKAIDIYLTYDTGSSSDEIIGLCSLLEQLTDSKGLCLGDRGRILGDKVKQQGLANLNSDSKKKREKYIVEIVSPVIAVMQANINLCNHEGFKEPVANGLLELWDIEPEKYKSLVDKWALTEEQYEEFIQISKECGFRSLQIRNNAFWPLEN